jgi:hypothetical protein
MKDMEECRNVNESRVFYRLVNRERKVFKPRVTMCRVNDGSVVTGKAQILKRCVQHFDNLLNRNVRTQPPLEEDIERNEDFRPTK